jgi:hypothetical protein
MIARKSVAARFVYLSKVFEVAYETLQSLPDMTKDEWRHRFYKRSYLEIDSRIATLVSVMNGAGLMTTYASCQGHAWTWQLPYSAFKSDADCACTLELGLRSYQMSNDSTLRNHWTVDGSFNTEGELVFRLWAPWLDRSASLSSWLRLGLFRGGLDSDFCELSKLVIKLFQEERRTDATDKSSQLLDCGSE